MRSLRSANAHTLLTSFTIFVCERPLPVPFLLARCGRLCGQQRHMFAAAAATALRTSSNYTSGSSGGNERLVSLLGYRATHHYVTLLCGARNRGRRDKGAGAVARAVKAAAAAQPWAHAS